MTNATGGAEATNSIREFCNGVIPFTWDRLPLNETPQPVNGMPCLQEDWFIEDAIKAGSQFSWRGRSCEESLRLLYRFARKRNTERGYQTSQYHWLILHQVEELLPAVFMVAGKVLHDQQGEL